MIRGAILKKCHDGFGSSSKFKVQRFKVRELRHFSEP
jgi:hypothetical protein